MTGERVTEAQQLLGAIADRRREELSATLTWLLAENLALRLGRSVMRERLLLFGDLMLHTLLGSDPPFEWDAELLALGPTTPEELARCLREVCDVDLEDGLDLELPVGGVAEPAVTSFGRQVTVTLVGALGAMRLPLKVVVRLDEQIYEKRSDCSLSSALKKSVASRVTACPLTTAVALLLRSIAKSGIATTRPKVLWNLYSLINCGKVEASFAPAAIAAAFAESGTPLPRTLPLALSEEFATHDSRRQMWEAYRNRARIPAPDLAEVVGQAQRTVWPWFVQAGSRSASQPFGGE